MLILIGAIFVALTIQHLKNADTASSERSSKNNRKGVIFLVATSMLNVILLLCVTAYQITMRVRVETDKREYSTKSDNFQFGVVYGIPAIQSIFNSVSFILISSLFREFVMRYISEKKDQLSHRLSMYTKT